MIRKQVINIHSLCSWSRGALLLVLMLMSLTAGARTKTKVFTFTDYGQSDKVPPPYPSYQDCCICGDDIPWGIHLHSGSGTFDDGLYFKNVGTITEWAQMYTYGSFNNVVHVTVNMAVADNGSGSQEFSVSAGSSGWNDFPVIPYDTYQGVRSNLITQDYEFDCSTSGEVFVTFFANKNTIDVVIKSISVTYDIPDEPSLGVSVITMGGDTIAVTESFKDDVLDDGGTVKFDGKKTLIVRVGPEAGLQLYLGVGVGAMILGGTFCLNGHPLATVFPVLYFLLHVFTYLRIKQIYQGKALNFCLGETARNIFIYGLCVTIGILIS